MAFIFISPNSAGMKREPRSLSPTRPGYPRERAPGNHVDARGVSASFLHGNARYAPHDGWKSHHSYPYAAGGRVRFGYQIVSKQPALNDLLTDSFRQKSFHELHQPAGENRPAHQT